MHNDKPTIKYLKDYKIPDFSIESLNLAVKLHESATVITASMSISRLTDNDQLTLDGENLKLLDIRMDGKKLSADRYAVSDAKLCISHVPASFILETVVEINPAANTALTGLYLSNGIFCTQCEAEGFRRITYFLDRPDVLTRFTTKITADKNKFPVLLSNGNLIEKGDLNSDHHVIWQDPFLKPCYLFALVAGQLEYREDFFITRSDRKITLQIYVEPGNTAKAAHAMTALKQAMRWDENVFQREYDLDIFMLVAVSDFNMGAMENKGLNIFNAKYILASEETATDEDYEAIAAVIAHEYFHNWSGNRVTCRDWFQLSLKEGFTIFRDQEFTSDTTSRAVKRIRDVRNLRTYQFPEDAGPMAHSVQPASYMEIDNFYTHTVYEKGAEVIRMLKLLIGDEAFYQGANLYFATNDGQAVTIEEFVSAMEQTSKKDLRQFRLWYRQAGTPSIKLKSQYDGADKTLGITTEQTLPDTPGQTDRLPMHIPIAITLYESNGSRIRSELLELKQKNDTWSFSNINSKPVLSLLNDFSAPVELKNGYAQDDLCFLMQHDQNPFSRWEAGQIYIKNLFLDNSSDLPVQYLNALQASLLDGNLDYSFRAELLALPPETWLLDQQKPIFLAQQHERYKKFELQTGEGLKTLLKEMYHKLQVENTDTKKAAGARKLKNHCLYYLSRSRGDEVTEMIHQQYKNAKNMTDRIAAFRAIIAYENPWRQLCIDDFYQRFENDALVLDKWFTAQAIVDDHTTLNTVAKLMTHPKFTVKNPNRVRALIGAFAMYNTGQFHRADGKGYALLADVILRLNKLNPQIAARLLGPLIQWRDYAEPNQKLMLQHIQHMHAEPGLSPDVYEIITKALPDR